MNQLALTLADAPCCARPNIAKLAFRDDRVNNTCLHCGEHWYGAGLEVTRYTRKEWDALMNSDEATFNDRISA